MSLSFSKINYSVTTIKDKSTKTILNNCTGTFRSQALTAIMGPSGAGKTSLLNILSGRVTPTSGSLILQNNDVNTNNSNNSNKNKKFVVKPLKLIHGVSAYVQQDDCMLATQTVRETIIMSALLTLPMTMTTEDKIRRAEEVIELFGLTKCADTYIGDPSSKIIGISGGERKRTSIAMSCVSTPSILYLDEPTSGLDSFIAFSVVKILKKLCDLGVSVVTTIHQPSSDTFSLFDDLIMITEGQVVYHGGCSQSVTYFGSIAENGEPFACPEHSNPSDYYFMHVLTCGDNEEKVRINFNQDSRTKLLVDEWNKSALKRENSDSSTVDNSVDEEQLGTYVPPVKTPASTFPQQLNLLFKRSWREATRNPMRVKAQFFQSLMFAIIISTIWWGLGNTQESIQDRNGVLFFMSANGMMSSLMGILSTFGNERSTFIRDYENNLYGVGGYFLGKVVCDAPFYVIFPTICALIMHTTIGFQYTLQKYIVTIITMILLNFNGMAFGLVLASIFADIAVALLIAPLIIMPLMMFSGFFLNTASVPIYFRWVPWISPMKYAFTALARNEYNGLDLYCRDDELMLIEIGVEGSGDFKEICPFSTGEDFLETFNIEDFLTIPVCHIMMIVMTCLGYVLAYLCLLKLVKGKTDA
jgi:ATP-binding cassette subfamily G (WHITE) protein 1